MARAARPRRRRRLSQQFTQTRNRQHRATQIGDAQERCGPLRDPRQGRHPDHFRDLLGAQRIELPIDPEGEKATETGCAAASIRITRSLVQLIGQCGDFLNGGRQILGAARLLGGGSGRLARSGAGFFGSGSDLAGSLGDLDWSAAACCPPPPEWICWRCRARQGHSRFSAGRRNTMRLFCISISVVPMICSRSALSTAIWSRMPRTVSLARSTLSDASRDRLRMSLETTAKPCRSPRLVPLPPSRSLPAC